MKVIIEIELGNDALPNELKHADTFDHQTKMELRRILAEIREKIDAGHIYSKLKDLNGNSVGKFKTSD